MGLFTDEALCKQIQILLSPTVCPQLSPLIGCGFEAFGEDHFQNGILLAYYTNDIQERGVATCIKHYATLDQSDNLIKGNAWMSDCTLREMHPMPFQLAIEFLSHVHS